MMKGRLMSLERRLSRPKTLGVKHFEFLKIPATMVNQVQSRIKWKD